MHPSGSNSTQTPYGAIERKSMELSFLPLQAQGLNDKSHRSLEKIRLRALDSRG